MKLNGYIELFPLIHDEAIECNVGRRVHVIIESFSVPFSTSSSMEMVGIDWKNGFRSWDGFDGPLVVISAFALASESWSPVRRKGDRSSIITADYEITIHDVLGLFPNKKTYCF